jgi:hypothetical protein
LRAVDLRQHARSASVLRDRFGWAGASRGHRETVAPALAAGASTGRKVFRFVLQAPPLSNRTGMPPRIVPADAQHRAIALHSEHSAHLEGHRQCSLLQGPVPEPRAVSRIGLVVVDQAIDLGGYVGVVTAR